METNIWPVFEVNPFFFLEGYNGCMSMPGFFVVLLYIFVFDYMAMFDLLCCVPSHCHYKLKSPSDKLFPFTHEDVTHQSPAVRFPICWEGMEGVAWREMFLVCSWGGSRQLCDPESTFERQLKHKQAPKPAGIAHLLLQIIKQIKRGQRWCKMTLVYLWGLCSLLERRQVWQWAAEGTLLVPALCTGAELWSEWGEGIFVGPAITPARMCSHSSLYLYPLFWRVCTPCNWCTECCCRSSFSLAVTAPSTFFFWFCTLMS